MITKDFSDRAGKRMRTRGPRHRAHAEASSYTVVAVVETFTPPT